MICYVTLKRIKLKEIHEDLVAVSGYSALSYSTVKRWGSLSKAGRETVEDNPWSGYPSTAFADESMALVESLVMEDRQILV